MHPQRVVRRRIPRSVVCAKQRGGTLIMVIIALAVLLVSAAVILRSSNAATTVAGNIAFQAAANQAGEVAINDAMLAVQNAIAPDTAAALAGRGSYFATMLSTDSAGLPTGVDWTAVPAVQSGNYQLQWVVDRLCNVTPVTNALSQCQTSQGPQTGNSIAAGAVQFTTPPRVFYRVTVLVTGPKATQAYVQALVAQ